MPSPPPPPSRAILARLASPKPAWKPNRAAPPDSFAFTIKRKFSERILCIGDTHYPFVDAWREGQVLRAVR